MLMNRFLVVCGLLASMVGTANAWNPFKTTGSIRRAAIAAGHDPVNAEHIANDAIKAYRSGELNGTGLKATINSGNVQVGLTAARATRWGMPR
jgi:hypothetical protein